MSTRRVTDPIIVAAVDYSETSSQVVQHAVDLVRQKHGGELHFLHIDRVNDSEGREALRAELLEWLDARLQGAEAPPKGVKVFAHELSGDPAELIAQLATDLTASVVVVGTHDRTGVERVVLGSVAEAVARYCSCPVLIVRDVNHERAARPLKRPCPKCADLRARTEGDVLWCDEHAGENGRRHARYEAWVARRAGEGLVT